MGGRASIILVMGFAFVLGYVSMNLNKFATEAVGNMTGYFENSASHNLALAGANAGLAKFYQDTSWHATLTESFDDNTLRGSFTVGVVNLTGNRAMLRSVSTYPSSAWGNLHDTVEVYFNTVATNPLTQYAWFANNNGNVFWQNGDTVWGRAHANGNVHIAGAPVFMNKFTTAKKFDPPKPGTGTNQAIFKNGYETGVATIPYPTSLAGVVTASNSGGKHYTNDISVQLLPGTAGNNDGLAAVLNLSTGVRDTVQLGNAGFNGVILSDGNVSVSGVLDGRLSVASLKDVKVTDDCTYEQNPRFGSSDDQLGLIAANNVVVSDNAANHSNCAMYSAVFTLTGSVVAENLASLPVCGDLTIYGCVIQNTEQEVGVYLAKGGGRSKLKAGFWKDFKYDARLANPNSAPPYFPGYNVATYAITNWWESYRVPRPS
jgi:hypothetical protein